MGRVGTARYDMRIGHLSHLERTFRVAMVKARALLASGSGDGDLASAMRVLEGLAGQGARLPRRMRGLVCAGIARLRLLARAHDTRHPTRRDTAREPTGLATIEAQSAKARRLLLPHGRGTAEDIAGTARLHTDLAAVIEEIVAHLETLSASLPASPERDAMYECLIPYDVPADLHAVAEVVCDDYLQPAVRALSRAARINQAALDERFRDLS